METYFLDTSALVKKYVTEDGSRWITACCQPSAGNTLIISQATLVEAVAAFCSKARTTNLNQQISEADRDRNIDMFRQDTQQQYNVVQVTATIYLLAGNLCRIHTLRAYDAIQLACALQVHTTLVSLGVTATFVSADKALLNIAQTEGLKIENPNAYP